MKKPRGKNNAQKTSQDVQIITGNRTVAKALPSETHTEIEP
jgi:hypothetical protein